MRNRLILIIALAAAVLLILALRAQQDARVTDLESRPLLDAAQLELLAAASQLQLARGELSATLAREGEQWTVADHHHFPLQRERLAALLHALRGARILEAKTANPAHHARLGLDASAPAPDSLQLTIEGEAGSLQLLFGERVGNGQLMRFADQDQVWLINRPLQTSVSPRDWLDLQVVQLPLEEVQEALWQHADGEQVRFDKAAEGDYNLRLADSQEPGYQRWINGVVLGLVGLRAQDVQLREQLQLSDTPMLRMQLQTRAGDRLQAALQAIDGRYWVLVEEVERVDGSLLQVNADPRWAFQIGIAEVEALARGGAELLSGPQPVGEFE